MPEDRQSLPFEPKGSKKGGSKGDGNDQAIRQEAIPVSYTHLTLPTNREV